MWPCGVTEKRLDGLASWVDVYRIFSPPRPPALFHFLVAQSQMGRGTALLCGPLPGGLPPLGQPCLLPLAQQGSSFPGPSTQAVVT